MIITDACSIIILGATGDLTKRKLIPAIYRLVENKKLTKFSILGAAFSVTTAEQILNASRPFIVNIDEAIWQQIVQAFTYHQMDFYKKNDYISLKQMLEQLEASQQLSGNRLFYLATLPEHFTIISKNLAAQAIVQAYVTTPWSRVVYEKPFGYDAVSAKKINKAISKVFSEQQVFRIDHYLGKDLVGNIATLRFTNLILEPLWNRHYIDSVQIIVNEKIGIEGRGQLYEKFGLVRDVVQNHLLQLLSLVAMEAPLQLAGEYIRDAKVKVLKKLKVTDVLLGQYEGYTQENGVINKDSKTETFAALKLELNSKRWQGVPFYLKAGKCLNNNEASIHIKFKKQPCLMMENCPTDSNYLTIQIQPEEGFFLEINAKVPGAAYAVTPAKMSFCHKSLFGPNTPRAYEVLLFDAMRGDQSVFVRFDEIEHSWNVVAQMNAQQYPLQIYKVGSAGPEELKVWSKKNGVVWRN